MNIKKFVIATVFISTAIGLNFAYAAENSLNIFATKTIDILLLIRDKKLVTDEGYIRLQTDGKITGMMNGAPVTGGWSIKGDFYCRSITYGDKGTDTDCQIILNTDKGIVFHRHRGVGRKVGPYLVQTM